MSRLVTSLLIAALAVTAQPWAAWSEPALLSDLGLTPSAGATEEPTQQASGRTYASDGVLRKGCRYYRVGYELQLPTDDWELTLWIVDRHGDGVASHAFFGPVHDQSGTMSYQLCRAATVPGKFRIRARVFWYDDPMTPNKVDVPVTRFKLGRPQR